MNAELATVSSSGRSTAVVWWVARTSSRMTVPADVARDVRRMLQELGAEDGARQAGTVERLGRHPNFQFDEMD